MKDVQVTITFEDDELTDAAALRIVQELLDADAARLGFVYDYDAVLTEYDVAPRHKVHSIPELRVMLRSLTTRTVAAFDALGIGSRNKLYEEWSRLSSQGPGLDDVFSETFAIKQAEVERLESRAAELQGALSDVEDDMKRAVYKLEEAIR